MTNKQAPPPKKPVKTHWHRILASVLSEWLTPVGIKVQSEVAVTTEPQKADILLLTHKNPTLNKQQRLRLSDGLRHSTASNLLLEFKYTESLNENAIIQLLGYGLSYTKSQKISPSEIDLFLLCSKTPHKNTLQKFGFIATQHKGILKSKNSLISRVTLILLNNLENEAHNIPLKCFASKKQEIKKAYKLVMNKKITGMSLQLEHIFFGLWEILSKGESKMDSQTLKFIEDQGITPEYLIEQGKMWSSFLLKNMSLEERLKGITPEDRLQGLTPEDIQKLKDEIDKL
jgi:hypothetical protein